METEQKKYKITWQAPEFIHYPKNLWWFGVLTIAGFALITYFLWQKEFLTATLFALLFILISFFSKAKPKTLTIELDHRGVKLDNRRIPYEQLKAFWLVYDPPNVKTLNFETTAYFNRYLTLQLTSENPVEIRKFLLQYLPEDLNRGEQFADKLSRTLKF